MKGLTRVSVASAEENYHDGDCGNRAWEEAAHLKRVVGASFGRNSTDVLFEWPAMNFVFMDRDCSQRAISGPKTLMGRQTLQLLIYFLGRPVWSLIATGVTLV